MLLHTTLIGREIVASALTLHRDMCFSHGALARRLGFSEKESKDGLATNKYLEGAFGAISSTETGDVDVEIATNAGVDTLRKAVILWVQGATKKDQSVHQFTLGTDFAERQTDAQSIVDQLSSQLKMDLAPVSELAEKAGAKAPKEPKPKKDKKEKQAKDQGPALVE